MSVDEKLFIDGAAPTSLDGVITVESVSGDTFTYSYVAGSGSVPAPAITAAPINGLDFVIGRADGIQDGPAAMSA